MAGKNGVATQKRALSTGQRSFATEDSRSKEIARTEKARRESQISMASNESANSEDESEDDYNLLDDNADMMEEDKDEAELELEKLVFGDSKGFMDNIHAFGQQRGDVLLQDDEEASGEDDADIAGMKDQDLFFMDTTGTGMASLAPAYAGDESSDEDISGSRRKAAWEDSDDERLTISLAAVPRLRKLRVDADDDVVNGKDYIKRLRKQFLLLNPTPDWVLEARQQPPTKRRRLSQEADEDIEAESDEEDEPLATKPLADLLRNASALVKAGTTKRRKIKPETLHIQRVNDVGITQPSSVDSISFHPTLPLLLTSGPSGTLYLHHIIPSPPAPEANPLLTSLHLKKTALSTSAFHPTDSRIFLSARRRYFHVWDVASGKVEKVTRIYGQQHEQKSMEVLKLSPCGRFVALKGSARKGGGLINILNADTLQWRCQLRIDSGHGVADFAWWRTGDGLTVAGVNGEVTEWNVLTETITGRWSDAGAVGTTVLALGGQLGVQGSRAAPIGNDRWVAIGSSSGIVNIYDRGEWYKAWSKEGSPCPPMPQPTKVLDHLTTATSSIAFSPDAQILAIASRAKKDALRLVHLPSCTVYKNWPTAATPLGRVSGVAFAAGRAKGEEDLLRMVVGNDAGKVRMWEIRP